MRTRGHTNLVTLGMLCLSWVLSLPWSLRAEEAKDILATVNGRNITEADIADKIAGQMARINNEIYRAKKQAVEMLIADYLIEQEAKKRGLSREQLLQQEVTAKVATVTDAEVEQFYNERKAQLRNKPLAEVKPQIMQLLKSGKLQKQREDFLQGLRREAGVKVLLEPPLVNVAVDGAPARGPTNAPITIVEFSDFQCPYCARVQAELAKVRETYKDKVKIVFKDFPLNNIHPNAQKAAVAARCAGEQEKYWEYHDMLFANQKALDVADLKKYAADLKLDTAKFDACLDSGKYTDAINKDLAEGTKVGVSGTPAFVVNGRFLSGAQSFEGFREVIDEVLAAQ